MNIGKLYETLTGERCPHFRDTLVAAPWEAPGRASAEDLSTAEARWPSESSSWGREQFGSAKSLNQAPPRQ